MSAIREMDDRKLLNGKFTLKSCVVQKKQTSLLSENVNRQLATCFTVGLNSSTVRIGLCM